VEIEELCTKFTADLSDFRKKMETFTDDLKRVQQKQSLRIIGLCFRQFRKSSEHSVRKCRS